MGSFDGTDFTAIDEDATAPNAPLDTFIEQALRSSLVYLDSYGHGCTWSPRCRGSANTALAGWRPYTSADWTTILHVPWLVQPGLATVEASILRVLDVQSASASGYQMGLEIAGLVDREPFIAAEVCDGVLETTLLEVAPKLAVQAAQVLPLTLWGRGLLVTTDETASEEMTDVQTPEEGNGAILGTNPNTLVEAPTATRPSATDDGVRGLRLPGVRGGDGAPSADILWAWSDTTPDIGLLEYYGAGERQPPYQLVGIFARTYPLGYAQIRSVSLVERFERVELRRDRYLPRAIVEAADTQRSLYEQRQIATRARPIFIGPQGATIDPELGNATGYAPRFERVAGSSTATAWLAIPLDLRTIDPQVRILLHVVPIVRDSGWTDPDEGARPVRWEVGAEVLEPEAGATLGSNDEQYSTTCFPTCRNPKYPFLTQEARLEDTAQFNLSFKEGQLFQADINLVQLIDLTIDVTYDPADYSGFSPYLSVTARLPVTPGDKLPGDAAITVPSLADYELVCVGVTVWEVPRG